MWAVFAVLAIASAVQAQEREQPSEGFEYVTCGSAIKLEHTPTGFRLHSHEVQYGTGSGQQSVTLKNSIDDHNSLWSVLGPVDSTCKRGNKIKCGATIRLKHASTNGYLHSHSQHKSPLSKNQEVTVFQDESNQGDHWKVECDEKYWRREYTTVQFKHVVTRQYLHSTGRHQFGRPIAGQREVSAAAKSGLGNWRAMEGIYIRGD
eukprot:m.482346 g.482346  ORF g.482346 m.482346 type:complete len:205 (+) comp22509_c0_seq1:126-740(+)